ncbi:hypothetical protein GMES_3109 [Paraglaciecola mesophila KMM 241]|uniref:Porin domain-containing protein n=1 Tax=Paraglaciecola mesophila KMM 241 TaxID=1128912 RepID=K6Z8U2_9ALTE|nr:porin [Paraglaciecola mesophila]GAC25398.1 hypothetical protein GMES_3109 [Paraglaciecola mesophila KMM 241]|tara:strand:- start:2048 stop:3166 length:1119 start_codon:yes stop_codon:yes gene_type:complete
MKNLSKTIVLLTSLGFGCAANAELRINGFANLVGGITSSDDTLYGYDDKISFSEDSLFAIQLSGDINDKMTATGQIVARGSEDYDPEFEWAYITYQATDNVSISAGRLRIPLFRYSSSLDVGYSYHWISPPQSVYDVTFNNLDGLRVDYSNYAGDWEYNIQLAAGTYENTTDVYKIEGRDTVALTAEAAYEFFKVRAVYGRAKTSIDVFGLEGAFAAFEQVLPTKLYNDLEAVDDTGVFLGLGLEYDTFDWFVSGEITSVDTEKSYIKEDIAYFLTAGLRIGKFTPSITYEVKESDDGVKFTDQISQLPAALQAQVIGVQAAFDDDEQAVTLGLRYDYATNVALKAEVTRYTDDLYENSDANLLRFAVNYIF